MVPMEFPLLQLASCKIVDNSNGGDLSRAAVEDVVGGLLETSSNLQRLHLVGGETLAHVSARISAIQELVLEKYDWRPDPTTVPLQWDLSKLTHLELKNMNIGIFLKEVRPDQLPQLRSFKTNSCTQYPDRDSWVLCCWIFLLSSLESLEFKCDPRETQYLIAIQKHAPTLRALDIPDDTSGDIDHDDAWHRGRAHKLLEITYPSSLRLRHLTLGINPDLLTYSMNQDHSTFQLSDPPGTKNILARFCDLRYLTVIAYQPYIVGLQANRERNSLTNNAARKFVEELVTEKMGVRFEEIVIKILVARSARLGYYEARGLAHSTYTYEGESHEDGTLSIREDMLEHSQEYAEANFRHFDR